MDKQDDKLKAYFKTYSSKIKDASFTEELIANYTLKKQRTRRRNVLALKSVVIGLCVLFASIGAIIYLEQNELKLDSFTITKNHGVIVLILSFIYVLHHWMMKLATQNH